MRGFRFSIVVAVMVGFGPPRLPQVRPLDGCAIAGAVMCLHSSVTIRGPASADVVRGTRARDVSWAGSGDDTIHGWRAGTGDLWALETNRYQQHSSLRKARVFASGGRAFKASVETTALSFGRSSYG